MRILYVCEAESGGIAEYALRQVPALAGAGAQMMVLCRPTFPVDRLRECGVKDSLPAAPVGEIRWKKFVARMQDGREVARSVVEGVRGSR